MDYKKLSKWHKWYLKYTDRPAYKQYKRSLQDYAFYQKTKVLQHPPLNHPYKALTSFKHSGNVGDIIYSLPTVWELSKNGKAHFYLHLNQPGEYNYDYHPLGNIMLSQKMADMLKPLLLYQEQIAQVTIYSDNPVDYNLDEFRSYSFDKHNGNITHWYFNVYGIYYDTSVPWLTAPKDEQYANTIVLARSHRYRSPLVSYGFLEAYPNKIFIGVPEEYEDMKKDLPDLEFKPVKDFLEMATIINSCRLFIGNQSFPFSLAEALKINRLLEVYYKAPNVIVQGKNGSDFIYQPQFEYAVSRLLNQPAS
jgi:hypothetical protein